MRDTNAELSNAFLCCSILGFGLISWLVWKCLLSPPARTGASSSSATAAGATGSSTPADRGIAASSSTVAARTRLAVGASSGATSAPKKDADDDLFSFGKPRHPPHLLAPENWERSKFDLSGWSLQGIVPFRSTHASGYETRLKNELISNAAAVGDEQSPPDLIVVNRRERARIFARIFSAAGGGGRPPNRGANIVVAIRHAEISCSKLQKALFLLGTYYNLFLLVDGSGLSAASGNDSEVKEFVKKMRSDLLNQNSNSSGSKEYKLNAEIIPPHRIAFSSTSKGRVAFVRQLHGTELVVDFDESVTKELERFGFRVLAYPKNSETSSALGKFLIP